MPAFSRLNLICMMSLLLSVFSGISPSKADAVETFPKYKMIDLGTLETDGSMAIAINENGQVLGTLNDRGIESAFLWDEKNGLKIIELPGSRDRDLFLNNKGQIAFSYYESNEKNSFAYLWDPNMGFREIGFLEEGVTVVRALNDRGQIIGQSKVVDDDYFHAFLWEQGKMKDLTEELKQQISANWRNIQAVAINSLGHIAITAEQYIENNKNPGSPWTTKSFLWKSGIFSAVFPEKSPETYVRVRAIDDSGNIIADTSSRNQDLSENGTWFLKPTEGFKARVSECNAIVNKVPVRMGYLPGKVKKDVYGKNYYAPGIDIRMLLMLKEPFFSGFGGEARISDQNSKGWVAGRWYTIYSTCHAFLAIPE